MQSAVHRRSAGYHCTIYVTTCLYAVRCTWLLVSPVSLRSDMQDGSQRVYSGSTNGCFRCKGHRICETRISRFAKEREWNRGTPQTSAAPIAAVTLISVCQRVSEKMEVQASSKLLYLRGRLLFFSSPFSLARCSRRSLKRQAPCIKSNLHNRAIVWCLFALCGSNERERTRIKVANTV